MSLNLSVPPDRIPPVEITEYLRASPDLSRESEAADLIETLRATLRLAQGRARRWQTKAERWRGDLEAHKTRRERYMKRAVRAEAALEAFRNRRVR